jgi:hypothetical protein
VTANCFYILVSPNAPPYDYKRIQELFHINGVGVVIGFGAVYLFNRQYNLCMIFIDREGMK